VRDKKKEKGTYIKSREAYAIRSDSEPTTMRKKGGRSEGNGSRRGRGHKISPIEGIGWSEKKGSHGKANAKGQRGREPFKKLMTRGGTKNTGRKTRLGEKNYNNRTSKDGRSLPADSWEVNNMKTIKYQRGRKKECNGHKAYLRREK